MFVLLGLFGLLLLFLLWFTRNMEPYIPVAASPIFAYSDNEVKAVCQEQIKLELVSPRSAEFSEVWFFDETDEPEPWKTVVYDVDAQNAFGVYLRERYGCRADANGTVTLSPWGN